MRPEYDDVRMKPGLGLKQQTKQWQGLITKMFKKKDGGGGAGDDRSELGR